MILVSVHCIDSGAGLYNGAYGIMFYNLNEAILFATAESLPIETGSPTNSESWTRVYNDGVKVAEYKNGSPV